MIFKDYYKILGLDNNKVTPEEIKIAFREQAKKYHPDLNGGDTRTEERFKDINEAYRVLSTGSTKRRYDRMWNTHVGKKQIKQDYEESTRSKDSVFSEFFNMFFGESQNQVEQKSIKNNKVPIKGENIETEINVNIEEAFYGAEKKISLRTVEGKMKTFAVAIPAGIRNSEKVRLLGQGKEGSNGGKNGDLFIKINIQDGKKYKLKGLDIYTDLKITPWEAALGTRISVDSIDETLSLCIPQGTESGEKVRIPNKGYKDGKGGRGDLIAEVKIMIPKKMSEEEKQLFEQFNKISKYNPREA